MIENKELTSNELTNLIYKDKNKLSNCCIEIINSCIFKCDHCYMPNKKSHAMDFSVFKKIVDELYNMGCLWILLTGGETLSHPYFKDMYIYSKEKGFLVSVNTNGYLINDEIVELFNKYRPYSLEISIYGYNSPSYEQFTHVKNSYETVDNNIKKLQANNINLSLKTVLTKKNYLYINKLKNYAKEKKLSFRYDYIVFPKINEISINGNLERLSVNDVISVLKKDTDAVNYFKDKINNEIIDDNSYIFQCTGGEDSIYIDSYGNINMCVVLVNDKYNINDYSINDAISHFIEFKKKKYSKDSKCFNCKMKSICRYCPARFYLETGDFQSAPNWYCDVAKEIIKEFGDKNV